MKSLAVLLLMLVGGSGALTCYYYPSTVVPSPRMDFKCATEGTTPSASAGTPTPGAATEADIMCDYYKMSATGDGKGWEDKGGCISKVKYAEKEKTVADAGALTLTGLCSCTTNFCNIEGCKGVDPGAAAAAGAAAGTSGSPALGLPRMAAAAAIVAVVAAMVH